MNKKQRKLFIANIDLAEVLAMNATCAEADYDELLREAERMLADAVMRYDPKKDGKFEKFATQIIKRALDRKINSNGNEIFTVKCRCETTEKVEFYCSGKEVLRAELKRLHRGFNN